MPCEVSGAKKPLRPGRAGHVLFMHGSGKMDSDRTVRDDQSKGTAEPLLTPGTALVVQERPLPAKIPARKRGERRWVFILLAFIIAGGIGGT